MTPFYRKLSGAAAALVLIHGLTWFIFIAALSVAEGARNGTTLESIQGRFQQEEEKIHEEYLKKLQALRVKYRKLATKSQTSATRRGNLQEALAWKEWREKIDPAKVINTIAGANNLARQARIHVSGTHAGGVKYLFDERIPDARSVAKSGRFWHSGQRGSWVKFKFKEPRQLFGIRFTGASDHTALPGVWSPIAYHILVSDGGTPVVNKRITRKRHPSARLIWKGAGAVYTIEWEEVKADEVVLGFTECSGPNMGPYLYEIEILGR